MRIGRPTPPVVLTAEERLTLEQWARRATGAPRAGVRVEQDQRGDRRCRWRDAPDRRPLAASLRPQAVARSLGRAAARGTAQDHGCRGGAGHRAHAGAHAASRDALEYARDGETQRLESDG